MGYNQPVAVDLFGYKKDIPSGEPEAPVPGPAPYRPLGRRGWWGLAAADGAFILLCAWGLWARVSSRHAAPPPAPKRAAGKPAPKAAEAKPEAKAEPAKPEAKPDPKAEPKKPEAKPEPKKPEAKKPEVKAEAKKPEPKPEPRKPEVKAEAKRPIGSPAVHSEPVPERKAVPKAPEKAAEAPPKPAAAAKPAGKKRLTRPVPFTHADASAKEVYLVGPFLVRSGGRKTLFKDEQGVWHTTIYLNVGQTYKYRFEVVSEGGRKKLTPAQKVEVLDED